MGEAEGMLGWSVDEIDRIVHEPARYMIISVLYVVDSSDFQFIKFQTGLTKGNLSSHLSKLEEAGYVRIRKGFKGKKPHTSLKLTKKGRRAFDDYRERMKFVLGY